MVRWVHECVIYLTEASMMLASMECMPCVCGCVCLCVTPAHVCLLFQCNKCISVVKLSVALYCMLRSVARQEYKEKGKPGETSDAVDRIWAPAILPCCSRTSDNEPGPETRYLRRGIHCLLQIPTSQQHNWFKLMQNERKWNSAFPQIWACLSSDNRFLH